MICKEVRGNELYVYWNGALIYKRWLDRGYGYLFDLWATYCTSSQRRTP